MEVGPERDGRACGFGCWTLGTPDVFDADAGAFMRVVCGAVALLDAVAATLESPPNSSILAVIMSREH
jgi:hypothetical protein